MGQDIESCMDRTEKSRLRERRSRHSSREDKANHPCEFWGKWLLATSPTGHGVVGKDLGVPSHLLAKAFKNYRCVCV